jgi:hypothetical protein
MITGAGINSIPATLLRDGRKNAASHKLSATDSPSNSIENKAKFTENRLSMVKRIRVYRS